MKGFIHSSAIVDDPSVIQENTKVWHFSHISRNVWIGKNCTIGQNVYIAPGVKIGNGVKIQNNVSVYAGVVIEDFVFIGPSVVFTNVKDPRAFINQKNNFKKTLLKIGASVGANTTIVCGVTIGTYSMIGAGTIITKDVNDYDLVYGSPPKVHGRYDLIDLFTKNDIISEFKNFK